MPLYYRKGKDSSQAYNRNLCQASAGIGSGNKTGQDDSPASLRSRLEALISLSFDRKTLIPALVGAGLCLILNRMGFLSLLYLVPLGFLAFRYNYRPAWMALFFAVVLIFFHIMSIQAANDLPLINGFLDIVFFTIMGVLFLWISSPPPFLSFNLPGSLRMFIGSAIGALLFIVVFFRLMESQGFYDQIANLTNSLISANGSRGADVVENAILESISVDFVMDFMRAVMLRGGSLLTCIIIFFASRQISLGLVRFTRRERGMPVFMTFKVYPQVIWILSLSLLMLVLLRLTGLEAPEIVLWNIFILCVMMYLAQGLGIFQFFLARPSTPPFLRLLMLIAFCFLLFSPVINTILFAGLVLLGIAENWVAFMVPKTNGPPSTPEV